MDFIRIFFDANRSIILFAYGLAFFMLGFAVALQSRRYSRLDLARSLTWLAAFGLLHGLHEWGDVFIPIQATYLNPVSIQLLNILQLLLLAGSFACLFEFGVSLLHPFGRARWLHGVSAGLFVAWGIVVFFVLLAFFPSSTNWQQTANALARYFIGFPASLLAAYGLRRQALQRIAPLNVPHIVNMLRIAGFGLALYAIFAGLITPPVNFFPGNIINTRTFEATLGIPPLVFRSLIGLILSITVIRALEVFDVETARTIEAMEQLQILTAERDRIARDLHDGAIQTVYTAGLLVESAQKLAGADTPLAARLDKAVVVLNDAIGDLRRNLSDLQNAPTQGPLNEALRRLVTDPRYQSLVDISLESQLADEASLTGLRTNHLLAILNEALANVVRHAQARQVRIRASQQNERLTITIQDDGLGLPAEPHAGYGLRNMRDRARWLGGELSIAKANNRGTLVTLTIPWADDH